MARYLILALCLLAMCGGATDAIDLDSLLVASLGGPEALDTVRNLTSVFYRGTAILGGTEGEIRVWVMPPDKFLMEFKSASMNISRGTDGHDYWERDQNGQLIELTGFDRAVIERSVYFETFSYLFPERRKGKLDYLGVQLRGPNAYYVVRAIPWEGDTSWAYINSRTALCDVMQATLDGERVTSTMSDYRSVSGILFPFVSRDTVNGMSGSSLVTLSQVDINLTVDPIIFAKPKVVTLDYRFPKDATSVTIPFSFVENHIFVRATLNGKLAVYLLLDSGASGNIYYRPTVESLDLPITGYLPVQGVAANDSVGVVTIDSLQVGELTLLHQVAGMMEESPIGQMAMENARFGGVLGFDFLSRFPIRVDYQNFQLTVYNPDQFAPPDGGTTVPFRYNAKVPTVTASVSGIDGNFLIDLGNSVGLIFHDDFAKSGDMHKRLVGIHDLPGAMVGIGGAASMKGAYVSQFSIGGVELGQTEVFLPESAGGLSSSTRIDGNIGNPILKRFSLLLDYPRQRLIFYPAEPPKSDAN